uniref:Anillin n=1 Tax=Mola mola TaxID=94237 RepID=A0A3Q3VQG3_MOLML
MDPFTEKLLERTRARRENLQKKMAERPNAASRPMTKRPLADANSVTLEPVIDKVPQVSTKPSPSKRRCSEETVLSAAGEENQEPEIMPSVAPMLSDPPTDKKPPVGPASVRSSSSLEKTAIRPAVQFQPGQLKTAQPAQEKMVVTPVPDPQGSKEAKIMSDHSGLLRKNEDRVEDSAPSAAGMKCRLQKLAEQRKYWEGIQTMSDSKRVSPSEVPPAPIHTMSSETPLGRRGRLANLAATIGSWEDDLIVPMVADRDAAASIGHTVVSPTASRKTTSNSYQFDYSIIQQATYCPLKSSGVVLQSPQKTNIPATGPATLKSVSSPQKSSVQGATFPSSPQKAEHSFSTSVPQSPLKNQVPFRGLSPQKPELHAKPSVVGNSVPQEKASTGAPGVKSFLERFGEKCQERNSQNSPARTFAHAKAPNVTPSAVTPSAIQDRFRAAQVANTTTADLTQRQKLERESELAQIRSRFQRGNMWKNKDEMVETKENMEHKVAQQTCDSLTKMSQSLSHRLMVSPPVSSSSPLKVGINAEEKTTDGTPKDEEVVKEKEMNVDQSINSAVINELFDGILEQSGDQEDDDDEEEDALNISSMSLLTPLAETVAAVVKTPERRLMTSTPASSFIVKSSTPECVSKSSQLQRTDLEHSASSDSIEASDEDHKLPYSIDAYRSTRVKETARPSVKQVIVRKENVSKRAEEPKGSSLFSIKQKMKVLTNEMNLQQTVIHQASQALNCCTDEEHGKGSQVEAEAQRLLLVATERREALKAELDCLKGELSGQKRVPAALDDTSMSASKGSITLQELRLPLKADFVCSTANKPEATKYSFFIMIRAGVENTVATPLASTHRGLSGDSLAFPTKFTISDVSSDFDIDIEVYGLVSDFHYGTDDLFLCVVVASPGGPNAVRTSNFCLVGSHKLTLSSIGKNKFLLEKVPFLCPLEGHIHLKMQCEVGMNVEEKGFLTMFEDVSGFGAWHRRWCVLSGYCISYWTYPDDEKRKNPIGRINLANCTSNTVDAVNREFCARPNTFELITVRPQREDDKETLVSQCQNTMCVTKNWLSADTRDERNLWMKKLNQTLLDLRMWQPDTCYRPL